MNSRRDLLKAAPAAALSTMVPSGLMSFASASAQAAPTNSVVSISIPSSPVNSNIATPQIFGFNVPWGNFQQWFVDASTNTVLPVVTSGVSQFTGAVYRYPGGTPSNSFLWRFAIGNTRPGQYWESGVLIQATFGIDEFLAWVQQLGGKVVYTFNMLTTVDAGSTSVSQTRNFANAADFANDAIALMSYVLNGPYADVVDYWEIGNEVDLHFSGEDYASYASALITQALNSQDARIRAAKIIVQTATNFATQNRDAWNLAVASHMSATPYAIAIHEYYEKPTAGGNGGSDTNMIGMLADLNLARQRWPGYRALVTEHALSMGDYKDSTIFKFASAMKGGIAAAEFTILGMYTGITASNWHAIEHGAAWELFHTSADHSATYSSAVHISLQALRKGFKEIPLQHWIGQTGTDYTYGQQIMAMRGSADNRCSVVGVNRDNRPLLLTITWPDIQQSVNLDSWIAGNPDATLDDTSDNVDSNQTNVQLIHKTYTVASLLAASGSTTRFTVTLPPKSVFSLVAS